MSQSNVNVNVNVKGNSRRWGDPWFGGAVSDCGDAASTSCRLGRGIHAADTPQSDTAPPSTVSRWRWVHPRLAWI
ncbi:hypothetical protein JY456_12190, partial [Stenotrophomonas maltophilia]|nr:hypothetical protein [Stenotrophomonas maltophilia]